MNETIKRTDIHRPSAINPTEYQFVAFEYLPMDSIGSARFLETQRSIIRDHMARTGGTYSTHEHGGNCMVCGSVNAIYTVLFYHEPTNTYVRMGSDCAQKCDIAFSNGDFDAFKRRVGDAREAVAGKRKAQAILTDNGLAAAWDLYEAEYSNAFKYEEQTIRDMVGKFVQYGGLSDRQFNYLHVLLNKITDREAIAAKRQADTDAAAPCPSGRITIEGTVLTVKDVDGFYGVTTKMLVKDDSGFKVYGTRPSKLNAERGDRVSFVGLVTPSNDDPKFGFFSRPSQARVLATASGVVA